RRALGATKGHIRTQFLAEATLLALAGGAAGVAVGALATATYATTQGWATVIPPPAWAGGLTAALLIGAAAGLLPALPAARMSPPKPAGPLGRAQPRPPASPAPAAAPAPAGAGTADAAAPARARRGKPPSCQPDREEYPSHERTPLVTADLPPQLAA